MNQLEYVPDLLRPIVDAIAESLRDGSHVAARNVSVILTSAGGRTLVVSLRSDPLHGDPEAKDTKPGLNEGQLQRVIGAIHERIGEPITVTDLSSAAGLSRSHFSHAFRATVGRSPHAHVVRLRLERAMKLMRETDSALSEIALALASSAPVARRMKTSTHSDTIFAAIGPL
jgi:transcriptional regulator GlxA family with amidase domain